VMDMMLIMQLGVLVPNLHPGLDVGGQFFHAAVGGTLELLGREGREPPFHHVHPGPVGGREVEVEAAVAQEPLLHLGGLMGNEVVQDHVHLEPFGHVAVDQAQEGYEVVGGVLGADVVRPAALPFRGIWLTGIGGR